MSRPALSSRRRPSSAIYLGNAQPPDLPSPPSPTSNSSGSASPGKGKAHLPSPPHTNSTGSKSSTGSGSVRVSTMRRDEEDDDELHERDEDDTARLSDDRRKPGTDPNQRSVQRVKSLTERNRQVLDKIASISSGTRLAAPSPTTRSQQPSPSTAPFPSATVSNRVSFTRSRNEVDFSGSETERESHPRDDGSDIRQFSASSSDDRSHRSTTPPASSSRRSGEYSSSSSSNARRSGEYDSSTSSRGFTRTRLISAPSPMSSPKRPNLRTMATANGPTSPRGRRQSVSDDLVEEDDEQLGITLNRAGGKKRSPLPREFTSVRRSLDGRPAGYVPDTPSRARSPEAYVGRGSPSPTGSPATFGIVERSPRLQRPGRAATLRENGGTAAAHMASPLSPHRDRKVARWSLSTDLSSTRLAEEPDLTTSSRSSRHRAQFSDGAATGRGAAPRDPEDVFGGRASRGGTTTRSIQSVLSRPTTSTSIEDDRERRARSRVGVQSPGATAALQTPASEHAKLMGEALGTFEAQLARFAGAVPSGGAPGATPTAPPHTHELLRSAATLVQSAQTLNTLLRAGTARALEAQIDAEVGDGDDGGGADGNVWRRVGGEYRECLRASDDVVRSVTGVLLGIGRVVRESAGHARTASDDGSAGMSGRRTAEGMRPSSSLSMIRMREEEARDRERERERERDERAERRRTADFVASTAAAQAQQKDRAATVSGTRSASRLDRRQGGSREEVDMRTVDFVASTSSQVQKDRAATLSGARSASRLERRRGGSQDEVDASPTPVGGSRSADFHSSAHARTLPPISIPPPLSTLPSETLLRRKASTPATSKPRTPAANRLSMASSGSAATIRASPAGAIVTPTTVTSPAERRGALASASFFHTAGRSRGASITLSGVQERDAARKRTLSSTDRDIAANAAAAATSTPILSRRNAPPNPPPPQTPAPRPRTERRRTVTEMFQ